ncbi:MAG: PQQ-binding-like beta-propeller repeat protein [Prolixibacteraceae bacterium]|nr:PQQ-binding-like beta-propeller repeat protein [Prolixibacteraceae bacterium]
MKMRLLLILCVIFSLSVNAQQLTQWRGGTNGIYPDKGLLRTWPADGPQILWSFEGLGEGHSSPVFAHDKIFVSSMIGQTGYIFILTMDGKEIKRYPYGTEFFESWPGTRSTPVIDGNTLYIYSGMGVIYSFDALSGTLKWKKEMLTEGTENIKWGVTETLVIDGDKLFCSPGGKPYNVVALNKNTGDVIWSNPGTGDLSAYCTPAVVNLPSRKILVTMMASHIVGFDINNGKLLWSYEQPNQWSVHANTPIYSTGILYCTSGYGQGTVALKVSPDGEEIEKVWFNKDFDSRMGGVVYLDGYLYSSGDKAREWRCLDAKTGIEKWSSTEVGKGVVVSADNMLFMYSEKGEIAIAEATPEKFKLLGKAQVTLGTAQHWAHPVIKNGILYIRHGNALIAYKIK